MANNVTSLPAVQAQAPRNVSSWRGVRPTTMDEALRMAKALAASGFAPSSYNRGDPSQAVAAIFAAIQMGAEVGLSPMASLQNIAVINGKPGLYGPAMLAVVEASGLLVDIDEGIRGEGQTMEAYCTVQRVGRKPRTFIFTYAQAERAKLIGKKGPWTEYPERMFIARVRTFAMRDTFPDVLAGLSQSVEELMDIPVEDVPAPPPRASIQHDPEEGLPMQHTEDKADDVAQAITVLKAIKPPQDEPEPQHGTDDQPEQEDAPEQPAQPYTPPPQPTSIDVPKNDDGTDDWKGWGKLAWEQLNEAKKGGYGVDWLHAWMTANGDNLTGLRKANPDWEAKIIAHRNKIMGIFEEQEEDARKEARTEFPTISVEYKDGNPDWSEFKNSILRYIRQSPNHLVARDWWKRHELAIGNMRKAGVISDDGKTGAQAADGIEAALVQFFPQLAQAVQSAQAK